MGCFTRAGRFSEPNGLLYPEVLIHKIQFLDALLKPGCSESIDLCGSNGDHPEIRRYLSLAHIVSHSHIVTVACMMGVPFVNFVSFPSNLLLYIHRSDLVLVMLRHWITWSRGYHLADWLNRHKLLIASSHVLRLAGSGV